VPDPAINLIRVDDLDDPRLRPFANQPDHWLRARHRPRLTGEPPHPDATGTGLPGDLFIAEGDKVVRRLIESPCETLGVLITEPTIEHNLTFLKGLRPSVPVFVLTREQADRLTAFTMHRGLLACGRRVYTPAPLELVHRAGLVVLLEDLANHDNVGSIFRSVRALAPPRPDREFPAAVLLTPGCCDPLYRKALRVSMGHALHVPFATIDPWPGSLRDLVAAGCAPIALSPAPGSSSLRGFRAETGRTPLLILGTEGPGLASETLDAVNRNGGRVARIDIEPAADSLNVAIAAAIALHHFARAEAGAPGAA
jgi:tRNA G18 (ribose-2'-O)-methylase SpoU